MEVFNWKLFEELVHRMTQRYIDNLEKKEISYQKNKELPLPNIEAHSIGGYGILKYGD